MPAALRGDARDLPAAGRAHARRHHRPREGRQGPRGARGAAAGLRRVDPRPAPCSSVSAWCWAAAPQDTASGPSPYLRRTREAMAAWGGEPDAVAGRRRRRATSARTPTARPTCPGRSPTAPPRWSAARTPRPRWCARRGPTIPTTIEDVLLLDRVQQWDDEIARLLDEAVRDRSPDDRGAAAVQPVRHRAGPAARRPGRVRPRPGPADAAPAVAGGSVRHPLPRLGRGAGSASRCCSTPTSCPGAATPAIDDDADLARADQAVRGRARSPTGCRVAVEPPFALVLAGQVVRGRIDAVYAEPTTARFLLVDWKTNRAQTADPLQLAIYRLAWAELHDVPARAGAGGVLLRPHRPARRAGGAARTRRARGARDAG